MTSSRNLHETVRNTCTKTFLLKYLASTEYTTKYINSEERQIKTICLILYFSKLYLIFFPRKQVQGIYLTPNSS